MPYFPAVGHIDDNLPPEEVMREYRRRYSLAAYHRRRQGIVERLGGKCQICKSTEKLAFGRKPSAPKTLRVNQLATMSPDNLKKALKHVRLLCEEHLKTELYSKNKLTHGTWYAAYKKKCRCDDCEEFVIDYNMRRREDRRDRARQA